MEKKNFNNEMFAFTGILDGLTPIEKHQRRVVREGESPEFCVSELLLREDARHPRELTVSVYQELAEQLAALNPVIGLTAITAYLDSSVEPSADGQRHFNRLRVWKLEVTKLDTGEYWLLRV